jgi:hypothetical protein
MNSRHEIGLYVSFQGVFFIVCFENLGDNASYYIRIYKENVLICRFNGISPSISNLSVSINEQWTKDRVVTFCLRVFYIIYFKNLEDKIGSWSIAGLVIKPWLPDFNRLP